MCLRDGEHDVRNWSDLWSYAKMPRAPSSARTLRSKMQKVSIVSDFAVLLPRSASFPHSGSFSPILLTWLSHCGSNLLL
jgi:hypothetical protein